MIVDVFKRAFEIAAERNWDNLAIAVDLHGTVFIPTYSTTLSTEFYPYAKEALQKITAHGMLNMYMYTCSHHADKEQMAFMLHSNFIYMEIESYKVTVDLMNIKNTSFQNFVDKPYFNILLEDKAGFDPKKDWKLILDYMKSLE